MFIRVLSLWGGIFLAKTIFSSVCIVWNRDKLSSQRNTLISLTSSWSKIFSSKWLFIFVFYLFSPRNDWSWIALCPEIEGYFNATNDLFQILFSNEMQTTLIEEITEYSKYLQWTCIRGWWWNRPWLQIFHPETFFSEW